MSKNDALASDDPSDAHVLLVREHTVETSLDARMQAAADICQTNNASVSQKMSSSSDIASSSAAGAVSPEPTQASSEASSKLPLGKKPIACIVIGMAGAGKTSFVQVFNFGNLIGLHAFEL